MEILKLAKKVAPKPNINMVFRPELMALDFEDPKTRRIIGGLTIDVLSDEIIMLKGLRGKKVLVHLDTEIFSIIKEQLPTAKWGLFTMEKSLYNKFSILTGIKLEPLYDTKVSGKEAYFVRATL